MLPTQIHPAGWAPHSPQHQGRQARGLSTLVAWLQDTHSHRPREPQLKSLLPTSHRSLISASEALCHSSAREGGPAGRGVGSHPSSASPLPLWLTALRTQGSEARVCTGKLNFLERSDQATPGHTPLPSPSPWWCPPVPWVPRAPSGTGLILTPSGFPVASTFLASSALDRPQPSWPLGTWEVWATGMRSGFKAELQLPGLPTWASASLFVLCSKSVAKSPSREGTGSRCQGCPHQAVLRVGLKFKPR